MAMLRGFLVGSTSTALVCSVGLYTYSNHQDLTHPSVFTKDLAEAGEESLVRKRGAEILKYGAPDMGPVISFYSNHVLSYDQAKKTPLWVAEHIKSDQHIKVCIVPCLFYASISGSLAGNLVSTSEMGSVGKYFHSLG